MVNHIEFLKERLETIEKRLRANEDYKELKVLKRIIQELEFTPETTIAHKVPVKKRVFNKDMQNSPLPELRYGERINYMYQLVEHVVKEKGGEIGMEELYKELEKHGIDRKMYTSAGRNDGRITSYLAIYNRKNIDNQTLALYPERAPGKKKVMKYLKVLSIGKERLKSA